MKIILLQDIKALGKRGDVKNVADGYARNFLLPRNLVKPASEAAIRELESQKAKVEGQLEELKAELQQIETATAVEPLAFQVKVGEKGEVFSSVGAEDIKTRLIERYPKFSDANLKIEADHIRELGKQEVGVKLRKTPKSGLAASGQVTIEVQPSTNPEA